MMATDVLLLVEDDGLRSVLEIALAADGYRVRTAKADGAASDILGTARPDLVILDLTAPSAEAALFRLHRDAPTTPHLLLVPAWGDWQTPAHPAGRVLEMPFGLPELRGALAEATASARNHRDRLGA